MSARTEYMSAGFQESDFGSWKRCFASFSISFTFCQHCHISGRHLLGCCLKTLLNKFEWTSCTVQACIWMERFGNRNGKRSPANRFLQCCTSMSLIWGSEAAFRFTISCACETSELSNKVKGHEDRDVGAWRLLYCLIKDTHYWKHFGFIFLYT